MGCALATLLLLANHPAGGGHTLLEVLSAEAREQRTAAIVHTGFVVTLAFLIACLMSVARILGTARPAVSIGLVSFCIGSGMLMLSMILDGLVVPAIAARFVAITDPATLVPARTALMLCGVLIGALMPLGLLFQAATMLTWSIAIVARRGLRLAMAICGILAALLLFGAILLAPPAMSGHVLLGAIVVLALWYAALALLVGARAIPGPQRRSA
ncbi:MAG TPA: hypothetical protein VGR80_11520 [Steroidobacteraceae bacterium]|nr:hypothetical protein [Steroidobacteraceae bacterium]